MRTAVDRHDCDLAAPFGISRGTTDVATAFVVRVEHEGAAGVGAATPAPYFGWHAADVEAALPDLLATVETLDDPTALGSLDARLVGPPPARAAVAGALADLGASAIGLPLYRQLGLAPGDAPGTAYTVGIADPATMAERAEVAVAEGFGAVKVKLGDDAPRQRFEAVRSAVPDVALRVDANGAWDAETTLAHAEWLAAGDATLLEQPVPADDLSGLRRATEGADLPVYADESAPAPGDIPGIAAACDGLVVKLATCGGPWRALAAVHAARATDLSVILGCFVAPAAAMAPAAHLAPLADRVDLDGALLLDEDPTAGVPYDGDRLDLTAVASGTGAAVRE